MNIQFIYVCAPFLIDILSCIGYHKDIKRKEEQSNGKVVGTPKNLIKEREDHLDDVNQICFLGGCRTEQRFGIRFSCTYLFYLKTTRIRVEWT